MGSAAHRRRDYLVFSALFCLLGLMAFSVFLYEGKTLIWMTGVDGINQHYPALMYEGMWLRDIAKSILAGQPEVRLWDFSIGYGSDVISTLSYYALGDPLNLLSALVPTRHTELLYSLIAVARLWLAGMAFVLYCHKMDQTGTRAVAGALSYAFCGYATYTIARHPFFCNPLIYLPLLLVGIERVYRDRRPALYIGAIFLSALSNYYFFYMLAICVAVYALSRFFTLPHERPVVEFLGTGAVFVALTLVGVACAGAVLLPTIALLLNNSRSSATLLYDAVYPIKYYARFVPSLFGSAIVDRWKCLGFAGPVLLGVTCLVADRKRHPFLLAGFVVMTALFLIPAAGSICNGFSYVTNRWSFAYTCFVCYVLVLEWDTLVEDPTAYLPGMIAVATVVVLAFALGVGYDTDRGAFLSLALYLLAMLVVLVSPQFGSWKPLATAESRGVVLTVLIICGLYTNAFFLYSKRGGNYVSEELDAGYGLQAMSETLAKRVRAAADEAGVEGLVRMDCDTFDERFKETNVSRPTRNTSMFADVSSTQYYWSVVNAGTSQYMVDLQLPDILSQKVFNLDKRIMPITLAAVNYEVVNGKMTPYGFEPVREGSPIMTSELSLPVGYTYDAVVPASSVAALDAVGRTEAMMQAAVVSDEAYEQLKGTLRQGEPVTTGVSVPVELSFGGDIAQIDDTHFLARKNSRIYVHFEGLENVETYLTVRGLAAEYTSDYALYQDEAAPLTPEQYGKKPRIEQHAIRRTGIEASHWNNNEYTFVVRFDEGKTKYLTWRSPYAQWTDNMSDFTVNLGYTDHAQTECEIVVPRTACYTIEDIEVVCQPLDALPDQVAALRADALEDSWYGTNAFGGTVAVDEPKLLCLAMPNEKGWSAEVDGESVELFDVNTMFMGVLLEPGTHEVRLTYRTHLLVPGLLASLAGFVLYGATVVLLSRLAPREPSLRRSHGKRSARLTRRSV